ncbi:nicotinamide riboside kinase 1 [Rhinatrema bivittatum]|uniref:nicotinamide riboside kinase 1 n=1 Tax=Rhinatrema bivittatum TaxID=194408 RepID=UPI00112DC6AC|nr:nicotinamide riboside kinase 1 [Rhinatrema bivittatum]XP_029471958.1 nicotinamide riboside kinase 1 [Rhinatrema bivittatum]XP_029471968.1 nicotinamide riboside kinase 1 [Rhinatrema bivittatum]XP_029471979.1 nicotinamide riboside kinase 1 [Rhinatrema bivittatum]
MKTFIVGISGMTNSGKTTLTFRLQAQLPNCSVIAQDDYFKPESEVEVDENGFKQYDVLDALDMEAMMRRVYSWLKNPKGFQRSNEDYAAIPHNDQEGEEDVYFLIVEGFLLYNYKPLADMFNRRYFLTVPYEECKRRRSTRTYEPPDPPGYFDGHVWPMYLQNTKEMQKDARNIIVYLDGTKTKEEIFLQVYSDITSDLEKQMGVSMEGLSHNQCSRKH